eukprot:m51a1_g821 putative dis3-like exonuclease 1 (1134) ;mRNA; r:701777-705697
MLCADVPQDVVARKTRRGNVVNVVREHYLRTDISCRSSACAAGCPPATALLRGPLHVVPDARAASAFVDVLEHAAVTDVVVLQTVLEAVRECGAPGAATRVRALASVPGKRCVVVPNEHAAAAYVRRAPGQSQSDRRAQAVVRAAAWMAEHVAPKASVVLLCEDPQTRAAAESAAAPGVVAMTVSEYVTRHHSANAELCVLAQTLTEAAAAAAALGEGAGEAREARGSEWSQYLSDAAVQAGLKAGTLLIGKFHVSSHNFSEAEVRVFDNTREDMLAQWVAPSGVVATSQDEAAGSAAPSAGGQRSAQPCARVVAIVKRNWRPYVATFAEDAAEAVANFTGTCSLLAIPYDYRIPKIRVKTRQGPALAGDRLVVCIDSWEADSAYPCGHVVKSLGEIGKIDTEVAATLVENEITCPAFTEAVLLSLPVNTPQSPWRVPAHEVAARRDFRGVRVYSIDPVGCRDIDDALSVVKLPNGNYEIGVHIADPSYFVREGSLLDEEARLRSTTVYLPHTRFPMLPRQLSEDLCSLHEGFERLSVSVVYEFSSSLEVVSEWFGRTLVRSCHALCYEQAQDVLDGGKGAVCGYGALPDVPQLREELEVLLNISRKLRAGRLARGALELEGEEVSFEIQKATCQPTQLKPHDDMEVHSLVAEFMLLANESVAKKIHSVFPSGTLMRRHPYPKASRFSQLIQCAAAVGGKIDLTSNVTLSKSLNETLADRPQANRILKSLATRAMAEAEYFSTGMCEVAQYFHYGLASPMYTHFTSPIRRYADIVVHRLLIAALTEPDRQPKTAAEIQSVADHINTRHHAARCAQKDSMRFFQVLYFDQRSVVADAIVYSVRRNALLVHVPQYSLKSIVYVVDKDGRCLVDGVTGVDVSVDRQEVLFSCAAGPKALRLFDTVTVRVAAERSRCHKPDIKLALLHLGPMSDKERSECESAEPVRRTDIVRASMQAEKTTAAAAAEAAPKSAPSKQAAGEPQSLYGLIAKCCNCSGEDNTAAAVGPRQKQAARQNVLRRWAPTSEQLKELERQRTPQGQLTSWEDYDYDEQQQPAKSQSPEAATAAAAPAGPPGRAATATATVAANSAGRAQQGPYHSVLTSNTRVEDRYKDIIRAADQQVRAAAFAKSKLLRKF